MRFTRAFSLACIALFALAILASHAPAQGTSKLVVKSIGASESSPTVGDSIIVEVTVQNARNVTVTGITVDVKVFETNYGTTLIGTSSIDDLAGGASGSAQFTWQVEKAGTWHLKAIAKINGIYEAESNLSDSPEIKVSPKKTDSGMDTGTLIIIAGGAAATAIVVLLVVFLIMQKKKREEEERKKREQQKAALPTPIAPPSDSNLPKDYWEWKRERDAVLKPVGMSSDGTTVLGLNKKKVDTSTFEQPGEVYPCPKCGTHRENAFAHCPRCIATDSYDAAKNNVEGVKAQGFDVTPALEKLKKAEQLILSKKYIEAKKYSKDAEKIAGQIRDGTLQVPKPEEVHKCHSCGNEVEPDWQTCPFCETPLKAQTAQPQAHTSTSEKNLEPQKGIICRKCQNRVERDWTSCPFCGESLDPSVQSNVRVEQSIVVGVGLVKNDELKPKKPKIRADDAAACPNCKETVKSNWTSCPACGFVLEQKCPDCGNTLELGKPCKYCDAKTVVMAAEQKLIEARDSGIDLTQAEASMVRARDNLKAGNFDAAKGHAKDAENALNVPKPQIRSNPPQYQQYQMPPAQMQGQYPQPPQYPQYPPQQPQYLQYMPQQQYAPPQPSQKPPRACMTCGYQTTDVFVTVCPMCRSKM